MKIRDLACLAAAVVTAGIALQAPAAGRHVHGEKPLATSVAEGSAVVEVALHVLDVMASLQHAADTRASVELTTTCERPSAITTPVDLLR